MQGPTSDHHEIRAWAARHQAIPAEVSPYKFDGQPAVLRFLFLGAPRGTEEIRPITWERFFAQFDLLELALAYDDSPDFRILPHEASAPPYSRLPMH